MSCYIDYGRMLHLLPKGDFFEQQFKFAEIFNRLHLDNGEIGLLTAVMILNPGESWTRRANCRYDPLPCLPQD